MGHSNCIICKYFFGKKGFDDSISLHCFPKEENMKKIWMQIIGLKTDVSSKAKVCSQHFLTSDYAISEITGRMLNRLKKDAVPSLNLQTKVSTSVVNQTISAPDINNVPSESESFAKVNVSNPKEIKSNDNSQSKTSQPSITFIDFEHNEKDENELPNFISAMESLQGNRQPHFTYVYYDDEKKQGQNVNSPKRVESKEDKNKNFVSYIVLKNNAQERLFNAPKNNSIIFRDCSMDNKSSVFKEINNEQEVIIQESKLKNSTEVSVTQPKLDSVTEDLNMEHNNELDNESEENICNKMKIKPKTRIELRGKTIRNYSITKNDFKCNSAWNAFNEYVTHTRNLLKAKDMKIRRIRLTNSSLKEQLITLKKKIYALNQEQDFQFSW